MDRREEGLWRRAAALGSLWAAFEIVLGSFLHNLRMPLSGTVLASLGVVLLMAASQRWGERGLIWRAALICALMKSVSPSAVIFGPMVGIFSEGLLAELGVALLGRGVAGCAVAGALAVSWALVQKLAGLVFTYGFAFVDLYSGMVAFAARATGWKALEPATLIAAFFALQAGLGVAAGVVGWRLGRGVVVRPARMLAGEGRDEGALASGSMAGLAVSAVGLVGGLWLLMAVRLEWGAAAVLVGAGGVMWRHGARMRKLRRWRFWAEIAAVMVLSGLVLGWMRGTGWSGGLREGALMAVRAIHVVVWFTAISVELRNRRVVAFFGRGRFAPVEAALREAFSFLPSFLAAMPGPREVLRRPGETLGRLFSLVEAAEGEGGRDLIVTGERGAGKTTMVMAQVAGLRAGGVVSPSVWEGGERIGYDVVDVATGERRMLARRGLASEVRQGEWGFSAEGFEFGLAALRRAMEARVDVLVIDEVGPLELRGEGWAAALDEAAAGAWRSIWVVRRAMVEVVRLRYGMEDAAVVERVEELEARLARQAG